MCYITVGDITTDEFLDTYDDVILLTTPHLFARYKRQLHKWTQSHSPLLAWGKSRKDWEITLPPFAHLLVFGGGRMIDLGKKVAATHPGLFSVMPSTLSNDAFLTGHAVLHDADCVIRGCFRKPQHVLFDMDVLKQSPRQLILSGVGELVGNIFSLNDWLYAVTQGRESFDQESASLIENSYEFLDDYAIEDIFDDEFLWLLGQGLLCSSLAMELFGGSRPASGGEHALTHVLEGMNLQRPHGILVAYSTWLLAHHYKISQLDQIDSLIRQYDLLTEFVGLPQLTDLNMLAAARDYRDRFGLLYS